MVHAMTEDGSQPLLEIRGLHIRFGRQQVLRDLNLKILSGETLAVLGESGCGKTVLMKTMIGLIRPSAGEVLFDGRNLAGLGDVELTRQRVRFGFVFQASALFDSMTVAQNVAFPLRQHSGYSETKVHQIVLARLAEVGLPASVVTKKPAELSGGMRKRVGLARALALSPEVMLYDEPTTGLDPIMGDVINELIVRTRSRHPVTSVIVTHDMRTAKKAAQRAVMLYPLSRLGQHEPQIIYDGPADEMETSSDHRVSQFARGEAGERLLEMQEQVEG